MSLLNYNDFLNESAINESTKSGSFQFLAAYVNETGIKKDVSYSDILKDPKYKSNEGAILNEVNFFEHLLDVLDKDAREVSKEAEDLTAIILGGNNSNAYDAADTIFSDVDMPNGEKISVKASKQIGFNKVLTSSRIKTNQILSIIFTGGLSPVNDKEKEEYIKRLEDNDLRNVNMKGLYSIAACYKKGNDFIIEKTVSVDVKSLIESCQKDLQGLRGDVKGRLSAGFVKDVLGFKPNETYKIGGISTSDIQAIAKERQIILKKIQILPTEDLKKIASEFNLSSK